MSLFPITRGQEYRCTMRVSRREIGSHCMNRWAWFSIVPWPERPQTDGLHDEVPASRYGRTTGLLGGKVLNGRSGVYRLDEVADDLAYG